MTLSDLDRKILLLMAADCDRKTIAEKLGYNETTIRNHLYYLRKYYSSRTAAGLIVKLVRLHLLSLEEVDTSESAWVQRARANE
jgi:DNA-binding CsgD family transcriptional regulator